MQTLGDYCKEREPQQLLEEKAHCKAHIRATMKRIKSGKLSGYWLKEAKANLARSKQTLISINRRLRKQNGKGEIK